MDENKTVGEHVDDVVGKVSAKVEEAKGKLAAAKGDASIIARDISKNVKRAVEDAGDAVSDLIHKKE